MRPSGLTQKETHTSPRHVLGMTWKGYLGILYTQNVIPKRMIKTLGERTPCFKESLPLQDGSSSEPGPLLTRSEAVLMG